MTPHGHRTDTDIDTSINKQISQNGQAIKNSDSTGVPKREKVPRGSRLTPERLAAMKIGNGFLSDAEKQLFIDILFEFEGAIAFTDSEMGLLDPSIEPPVVIPTVPHEPWQQQNLRLPKAMEEAATEIVKEKLQHGLLEFSQGPYRSRYFLVEKKPKGAWRLINDVQQLNKVTIRDSGMPPAVDEFSEDFAGYPITSAIDYYSGYYQIPLDKESRDLTAFLTMLGLVRMTRLPTGWTNSVANFMRVIAKGIGSKFLALCVHLLTMLGLRVLRHGTMMKRSHREYVVLCMNMRRSFVNSCEIAGTLV